MVQSFNPGTVHHKTLQHVQRCHLHKMKPLKPTTKNDLLLFTIQGKPWHTQTERSTQISLYMTSPCQVACLKGAKAKKPKRSRDSLWILTNYPCRGQQQSPEQLRIIIIVHSSSVQCRMNSGPLFSQYKEKEGKHMVFQGILSSYSVLLSQYSGMLTQVHFIN